MALSALSLRVCEELFKEDTSSQTSTLVVGPFRLNKLRAGTEPYFSISGFRYSFINKDTIYISLEKTGELLSIVDRKCKPRFTTTSVKKFLRFPKS